MSDNRQPRFMLNGLIVPPNDSILEVMGLSARKALIRAAATPNELPVAPVASGYKGFSKKRNLWLAPLIIPAVPPVPMVRPSNIVEVKPEEVDLEVDEEKSRVRSAEELENDLEEAKRRRVEMAQQILIQSLLHWFSLVFVSIYGCGEALRGMTTLTGR